MSTIDSLGLMTYLHLPSRSPALSSNLTFFQTPRNLGAQVVDLVSGQDSNCFSTSSLNDLSEGARLSASWSGLQCQAAELAVGASLALDLE